MSLLDSIRAWRPRPSATAAANSAGLVPADKLAAQARREAVAGPAPDPRDRELVAQRDRLAERFTMMQADLGGVLYEMVVRDHVRMDVLTRKAAELQRVDADLAEVERQLRGEDGPPVGACPACAAPHGAHAKFCSRCGHALASTHGGAISPEAAGRIAQTNGSAGTSA
jgi:hypothetical protein